MDVRRVGAQDARAAQPTSGLEKARHQEETTVGWSTSKVFTVARIVAVAAVVSGLIAGTAARPMAQAGPDSHAKNVEGVWLVQVTQRNCETNAALGSFTSLVTFDGDGIVIESPGS